MCVRLVRVRKGVLVCVHSACLQLFCFIYLFHLRYMHIIQDFKIIFWGKTSLHKKPWERKKIKLSVGGEISTNLYSKKSLQCSVQKKTIGKKKIILSSETEKAGM